jgi:hypothetical protein
MEFCCDNSEDLRKKPDMDPALVILVKCGLGTVLFGDHAPLADFFSRYNISANGYEMKLEQNLRAVCARSQ